MGKLAGNGKFERIGHCSRLTQLGRLLVSLISCPPPTVMHRSGIKDASGQNTKRDRHKQDKIVRRKVREDSTRPLGRGERPDETRGYNSADLLLGLDVWDAFAVQAQNARVDLS